MDALWLYGDVAVRFVDTQGKCFFLPLQRVGNGEVNPSRQIHYYKTIYQKLDTSYVALTLERNTTKRQKFKKTKGIKQHLSQHSYLLHSPNGKYYVFKEYTKMIGFI